MPVPLSILDLAFVAPGQTARDSFRASVPLAQRAEALGYARVWYAEHHNIPTIASSATSVLIAHVAAHTTRIRLGAGGIMLPNHAPLTIAEQFGTLECLHPGRIDLALGRAPGSDRATMRALRRDPSAADAFPEDVLELQGYLGDPTKFRSPTYGRIRRRGLACRSGSSDRARSARSSPPRSVCRTRSPPISRPRRSNKRSRSIAVSSAPRPSSIAPISSPASTSSRPTRQATRRRSSRQ
jgi:hypothetical protein